MEHQRDDEDIVLIPGSFQDLMELLANPDYDSLCLSLAGRAFFVTPAQFLTILDKGLPRDARPYDYSCGILLFKSDTSIIHHRLVLIIARALNLQVADLWMSNAHVKQLLGDLMVFPAGLKDTTYAIQLSPDVAILQLSDDLNLGSPVITVEVMYAHRFTREQTEQRYKQYFRVGYVKVVICVRLHYGRGIDRAKQTAENLDRSAISMWILDKDGNIQTILG